MHLGEDVEISNEGQMMIGLCRLDFDDANVEALKACIAKVGDWHSLSSLLNAHGIAALAYFNLERLNLLSSLPNEAISFLKGRLLMSVSRNVFNAKSTETVMSILAEDDMKIVLLKGLALELTIYGNRGLRQMSDVDILLKREDCLKACEKLIDNGYYQEPVKSFFHRYIYADFGKHLPSLRREGFSLELHHDLFRGGDESATRSLYETALPLDFQGYKLFIPAPRPFFIYLVGHLEGHEAHRESQLRLYTDLFLLLQQHGNEILDPRLLEDAKVAGVYEALATRLMILKRYWKVCYPDYIDSFIEEVADRSFDEQFRFYMKSPKGNIMINKGICYSMQVAEMRGLWRKVFFVLGDIFPSISFMKKRYGCSAVKALLFYPHRLGKLWYLIRKK